MVSLAGSTSRAVAHQLVPSTHGETGTGRMCENSGAPVNSEQTFQRVSQHSHLGCFFADVRSSLPASILSLKMEKPMTNLNDLLRGQRQEHCHHESLLLLFLGNWTSATLPHTLCSFLLKPCQLQSLQLPFFLGKFS